MALELDDVEIRVLGCLMEKEASTPEYYPMTLNALVNACNQKSNREPVVAFDADTVEDALDRLREKGLASRITGQDMRVPKHAHRLSEAFNFGRREYAVMAELMLRGPQTGGELRSRTERMHHFDGLDEVENTLTRLMDWQPEPLIMRLARQPGAREVRYAHLLAGQPAEQPAPPREPEAPPRRASAEVEELRVLQRAIESLQREVVDLKQQVAALREKRGPGA